MATSAQPIDQLKTDSFAVTQLMSWAEYLKPSSDFIAEFAATIFEVTPEEEKLLREPKISEVARITEIVSELKPIIASDLLEKTKENSQSYAFIVEHFTNPSRFASTYENVSILSVLVQDLFLQVNEALAKQREKVEKTEDEIRRQQKQIEEQTLEMERTFEAIAEDKQAEGTESTSVRARVEVISEQQQEIRRKIQRRINGLQPLSQAAFLSLFEREIKQNSIWEDLAKDIYIGHANEHGWKDKLIASSSSSSASSTPKSWNQILADNPTLLASLRNYAKAVAFVRIDQGNAESIARMIANKLAQGQRGFYDIHNALLHSPNFLSQFQRAFYQEVALQRVAFLKHSQGNELYLLSDATDAQIAQFIEDNAAISNKLGSRALDILYTSTKDSNTQAIQELQSKGKDITKDENLLLQQHVFAQQTLEIYEREDKLRADASISISQRLRGIRNTSPSLDFSNQSAGELLLEPVPIQDNGTSLTDESYASRVQAILAQQNSLGDEFLADDGNYTEATSSQPSAGSPPRKRKTPLASKAKQTQERLKRLQQFGQVASKLAANPLALGAAGAGLGGLGILAGIATQAPALVGAGGAVLGGSIGATAGFFLGGIPGAFIGGSIGSALGGGTGYFGAQAAFANSGIPGTGFAQSAQASASQLAPGLGNAAAGIIPNATPTATSLLQGAGSTALNALGTIPGATSSFLTGAASVTPSIPITGIIGGITVVGTVGTLIIVSSQTGTFLMDSSNLAQSNPYFTIVKQPTPRFSEDPTAVSYAISLAPKSEYVGRVTITDAVDVISFRTEATTPLAPKNAPLEEIEKLKGVLTEEKNINYTIDFDASYDDTLVTNTLTLTFDVQDDATGRTFSANANVTFGQPPNIACWPATGTITQGPYATFSHRVVDAIDILNTDNPNTEIISPFSGRASFYNSIFSSAKSACYGNHIILQTTDGHQLVFAHMNGFASEFEAGRSFDVVAGTPLGQMGLTGTGLAGCPPFDEHLHYELNGGTGPTSILETLLPEALERDPGDQQFGVTGRQVVSTNTCRTSVTPPQRQVQDEFACLQFVQGDQEWDIQEELRRADGNGFIDQIETLFNDTRVSLAVCPTNGEKVIVSRYRGTGSELGCNFDGTGFAGAEWLRAGSELAVCNLLFDQPDRFGTSTVWHEIGHLFQRRNPSWTSFPDFSALSEPYLRTYPLRKTKVEDFAESFGACLKNNVRSTRTTPISFRGQELQPSEYQQHCNEIQRILDEIDIPTGP